MVRVLFLIQPHLHEKLLLATPLAVYKMARCSKKQKRAVILRWQRFLQRCFFHFEKSSFLMKTVLLKKVQKLDVAYEEYNRNPRRHTIIELLGNSQFSAKDEKLFLLHQSPGVSLLCWCFWRWLRSHFVSPGDWSTKWRFVVVVTHVTGMRTYSSRLI